MKNIHVLPTDKPSRLYKFEDKLIKNDLIGLYDYKEKGYIAQNIYITSDEEIKDCYYFNSKDNAVRKNNNLNHPYHHKIILTTDQNLIKSGVQAIDDEFLEWFVKNPSCEKVEVEKENICARCHSNDVNDCWSAKECSDGKFDKIKYLITIPEQKQHNSNHEINLEEFELSKSILNKL